MLARIQYASFLIRLGYEVGPLASRGIDDWEWEIGHLSKCAEVLCTFQNADSPMFAPKIGLQKVERTFDDRERSALEVRRPRPTVQLDPAASGRLGRARGHANTNQRMHKKRHGCLRHCYGRGHQKGDEACIAARIAANNSEDLSPLDKIRVVKSIDNYLEQYRQAAYGGAAPSMADMNLGGADEV